jgi:nucleoside 2-deoxyribosyltransferase
MSRPQKLYLAHPLPDRHWVREKELELEKRLGIELVNPFYDRDRADIKALDDGTRQPYNSSLDPSFVVYGDLTEIDHSDGVLCFVTDQASVGIYMELFYNAYVLHRPAYLIITNEKFFNHVWLRYCAIERFRTVNEFIEWWEAIK